MRVSVKESAAKRRRGVQPRGAPKSATEGGRRAKTESAPPRLRLDVDERRAQLIELGLAEFSVRAYDEISIERIAQSARISKGLLYHYFPTKRAFYVACVREAASQLLARLALPPETPPFERLNEQVDRYLEFVRLHSGAFATLMRNRAGGVDRALASAVEETRQQVLGHLTSGLGDVAPDASSLPLVHIALHGWIGLVEAASLAWLESVSEAKAPVASASEVRDLLVRALVSTVRSAVRAHTEAKPIKR